MTRFKGFTLVELMVVLAILAIVAFIAVPNFATLVRDNRVEAQAEELNSLFQYARSEAVIRRVDTFVNINSTTGEVEVCTVSASDSSCETIRSSTLEPSSLQVSGNQLRYRFNGTAASFRAMLCMDGDPSRARLLTVAASGSTTLHNKGKDESGNTLGDCTL